MELNKQFKPHPLLRTGIPQTLAARFIPSGPASQIFKRHKISVTDGDQIMVTENRPPQWQAGDRVVVLGHGLAGCEGSNYMIRVGRKLFEQGYLVLKVNLRACGPGFGLAEQPYHGGRSDDFLAVQKWAAKEFIDSPVTQIGFSLSASITIKMAGLLGEDTVGNLDSCILISPPYDLKVSAGMITKSSFGLFDSYFVKYLKQTVRNLERHYPHVPKTQFPKKMNIMDFDHIYTAPRCGYKSADHYYETESSKNYIDGVRTKTLMIYSEDDPVVDCRRFSDLKLPDQVQRVAMPKGGHVGFLSPSQFWSDRLILDWIKQLSRPNSRLIF